jgi:phosphoserine aminotransferase
MSSNVGTQPINWSRISVVYMGAQKNMGPAGLTIVIVKNKLMEYADPDVPVMCDWKSYS